MDDLKDMNLLDLAHLMVSVSREVSTRPVPVRVKHQLQDACSELQAYAATRRRPSITVPLPPRKA